MEARANAERARIEPANSLLLPIHVSLAHSVCSPVGTFLAVFVTFFPLVCAFTELPPLPTVDVIVTCDFTA